MPNDPSVSEYLRSEPNLPLSNRLMFENGPLTSRQRPAFEISEIGRSMTQLHNTMFVKPSEPQLKDPDLDWKEKLETIKQSLRKPGQSPEMVRDRSKTTLEKLQTKHFKQWFYTRCQLKA